LSGKKVNQLELLCSVLFILGFALMQVASSESPAEFNCYIRHLKSINLLEESFNELTAAGDDTNCSDVIRSAVNATYEVISGYNEKIKTCKIEWLTLKNYAEQKMKVSILRKVNFWQFAKEIAAIEAKNDKELALVFFCFTYEKSALENYCLAKYAIDNKLLDQKFIDLNPENLNTTAIDCSIENEKTFEMLRQQIRIKLPETLKSTSEESITCAQDMFVGDLRDQYVTLWVAGQSKSAEATLVRLILSPFFVKFITAIYSCGLIK